MAMRWNTSPTGSPDISGPVSMRKRMINHATIAFSTPEIPNSNLAKLVIPWVARSPAVLQPLSVIEMTAQTAERNARKAHHHMRLLALMPKARTEPASHTPSGCLAMNRESQLNASPAKATTATPHDLFSTRRYARHMTARSMPVPRPPKTSVTKVIMRRANHPTMKLRRMSMMDLSKS